MDPNRPWTPETESAPPLQPGPWVPPSSTYPGATGDRGRPVQPSRPPLADPGGRPPMPPPGPPPGRPDDQGSHRAPSSKSYTARILAVVLALLLVGGGAY